MKPILFSILIFLFTNTLIAQDTIVKRNGEEIKAKVEEVGVSEIKYKKFDNPNGPLYTLLKTDVFVIKYQNGSKEVFTNAESPAVAPAPKVREERGRRDDRRPARAPRVEYRQDRHSATRKIVGGSIMTGIGAPTLAGGIVLLTVGASSFETSTTGNPVADGFSVGLVALGSVITAGGIVLEVLGPITLSRGIKERRNGVSLNFTPIRNPMLDRYNNNMGKNKIGVTLTF